MKKLSLLTILSIALFANDDYIPLNNFTSEQKENYNFIKKKDIENDYVSPKASEYTPVNEYKKPVIVQENNQNEQILQKQNVAEKKIDKKIINDYQKENILKDNKNKSTRVFGEDFSITPKVSYMNVRTNFEGTKLDTSHEVVPEISFKYKNHTVKADYFNSSAEGESPLYTFKKLDTKWTRLAYLYGYYNANLGLAYNYVRSKLPNSKLSESFATLELHFENSVDNLVVNYGGFYGKNDHYIKNAYEYYLTLGYRPFSNDNLTLSLGYKNRALEVKENNETYKLDFKGPIVGISSTF